MSFGLAPNVPLGAKPLILLGCLECVKKVHYWLL